MSLVSGVYFIMKPQATLHVNGVETGALSAKLGFVFFPLIHASIGFCVVFYARRLAILQEKPRRLVGPVIRLFRRRE